MMAKEPRKHRIPIMLSDEELAALDDWQFGNRISTRSNAIRRLLKISATNGNGEGSRGADPYIRSIRIYGRMLDELKECAKANGQSLEEEIKQRIEHGLTSANNQITPRDLFAADALNALICAGTKTVENAVAKSFFIADAMMNERNK